MSINIEIIEHGTFSARKTPNKKEPNTVLSGDRFIPSRSASNFDLGHYLVTFILSKISFVVGFGFVSNQFLIYSLGKKITKAKKRMSSMMATNLKKRVLRLIERNFYLILYKWVM